MTAMHQARYLSAAGRNVGNFLQRKGHTPHSNGTLSKDVHYAWFMGMELKDLKHHLGVREKDTSWDVTFTDWLARIKAHAAKAGIKASFNRPGYTAIETAPAEDERSIKINIEHAKVVTPALIEIGDSPVKKVNPKKEARKAALEKSGTGNQPNKAQKVNADARRAEVMAGKTQRQPRILKR